MARFLISCKCCEDCVCGFVDLPDGKVFDNASFGIVCEECLIKENAKAAVKRALSKQQRLAEERKRLGLDPA